MISERWISPAHTGLEMLWGQEWVITLSSSEFWAASVCMEWIFGVRKEAACGWAEQVEGTALVKPRRLQSVTTPIFSLGKLRSGMLFDLPKVMHKLVVEPETRPKRPRFLSLPQIFPLQMQKCCGPVVQKEPITRLQGWINLRGDQIAPW